jgi:DNA invertase Pin-like site-specific DNA recombinase
MSEKIKVQHLARKAVLYIRQSSPGQVVQNQESQRLQYAMEQRLRQLGWTSVEIIDEDLGRSAAGLTTRAGFERMVAEVCLGQIGAVAAREVSRFARNSREWQHLVEVCRMVDCILIDQETVYNPRLSNDRLLLGLKGSLNEYELDLLRQRAVEARNEKARRGEFLAAVPVGFIKTSDGHVEMDPDQRVQEAIRLVYRKFCDLGAARAVLLWLLENGLQLPSRHHGPLGWGTVWKRAQYSAVHRILTNPMYAGAYAYGKSEVVARYTADKPSKQSRQRPRECWLALLPGHHEGYISWEEFEHVQEMLRSNAQAYAAATPGAVKRGPALLGGLLRCRRCGRKLVIGYSGATRSLVPRYNCTRGALDNGEPTCISFGGLAVDRAVSEALLAVIEPGALTAALEAEGEQQRQQNDVVAALQRDCQAARYAAERAARQFDATDPANRLVADELERRWNAALERVQDLEQRIVETRHAEASGLPGDLAELKELAKDFRLIWHHPQTEAQLKKRVIRTLIDEIIVDVDTGAAEIILVVHWQGGVHTELRVPRRRRGTGAATSTSVIDAVRSLVRIASDERIAAWLNRGGHKTGRGNRWTKERVATLRSYQRIPAHSPQRAQAEGWLTLSEAAQYLGISPRTLRVEVERGGLPGDHPLRNGPWIFQRQSLETEGVKGFVRRVQGHRNRGAVPGAEQRTFDFSGDTKEVQCEA